MTRKHKKRMSLVGWSLGGIYAREIAKKLPSSVRQVITIGTPFAGTGGDETHVGWLYRLVSGNNPTRDAQMMRRLRTTPPVPTTSIYSRSDGIVAWQACLSAAAASTRKTSRSTAATSGSAGIRECSVSSPIVCSNPKARGAVRGVALNR